MIPWNGEDAGPDETAVGASYPDPGTERLSKGERLGPQGALRRAVLWVDQVLVELICGIGRDPKPIGQAAADGTCSTFSIRGPIKTSESVGGFGHGA